MQAKILRNKQKTAVLDRDGTINEYVGFLCNADDSDLIDGIIDAIRKVNESDYFVIVVSNLACDKS